MALAAPSTSTPGPSPLGAERFSRLGQSCASSHAYSSAPQSSRTPEGLLAAAPAAVAALLRRRQQEEENLKWGSVGGGDVGKLQALSTRLQGAHLRPIEMARGIPGQEQAQPFAEQPGGSSAALDAKRDVGATMDCASSSTGMGFLARGQAFCDALVEKKAKVSVGPLGSVVHADGSDASETNKGVLQRDRLTEWMALTVQHAPPSKTGRSKAIAGGLQDTYVRAVRSYLTDASLVGGLTAEATDVAMEDVNLPSDALTFTVTQVHFGAEGLLLAGEVLEAPASGRAAPPVLTHGAPVRLVVNRRHPALQEPASKDAGAAAALGWVPRVGDVLEAHGLKLLARGGRSCGARGPLLMTVKLLPSA